MRIRKKNQNEYLPAGGLWVRNFTREDVPAVDLNVLTRKEDYGLLLRNQVMNTARQGARIDLEAFHHRKVVIVSDGHGFAEKHGVLASLPPDVAVIGVNGALARWGLAGKGGSRAMTYYVVNNPYPECMSFFPRKHRYFPKCVASVRTNPEFLRAYKGVKYHYAPVPEEGYAGPVVESSYHIDDYRNPVCAAVCLSHRFGADRLLLLCTDDAYDDERPGAVGANGRWMYPAQLRCSEVVDGCLHWLRARPDFDTRVAVHGGGPEYKNAAYIPLEDVAGFFGDD
jgi:hypothetical protein